MDTNTLAAQVVATDTRGRRISARRHRSIQEKRAMVAESQAPGASVAEVARRHGVNANLLFVWRRLAERGLLETHTRRGSGRRLVPVKLLEAPVATSPARAAALRICFPGGIELIVEGRPDRQALECVLQLLRC